ncbi:hypothetical protein PF005_g5349 [Phytophthora fragariae]|uniref:Uncharacterized protein n=2 Tax=Phytophthora TaxID=4783 RepID=A0A6A3T311_9STRA|nr:hypothetical protein PR002_g1914 [Phytophthora rubi]KAE9128268.1 hypothetical protein PF007_g5307 [Phytophthora fragariae]KAE9051014.1 hypothetical protein PR001_g1838 [Phytophthora rubi]KAE9153811.1 hypothetical protein PF006_g2091 [Phytophthora fragariae]KAE9225857.1 hypothetical protein PF005_g5349 [Phytophthora fragariae]
MASDDADDFNRLYERLVVRRTNKKKRGVKRAAATPSAPPVEDAAAAAKALEAARLEDKRREEQREHEAKVSKTVRRMRIARNLGWEQDFLERYRRLKRQHVRLQERSSQMLDRCMRLERIAARLYLNRAVDFRPDAPTTLEGKHQVIDDLLLFSPPSARIQSQIGYADRRNIVPLPPSRLVSSGHNDRI